MDCLRFRDSRISLPRDRKEYNSRSIAVFRDFISIGELYKEFRDATAQQVPPSIIRFESLSDGSATHSMFAELQQTVSIAESKYMGDSCCDS